MRVAMRSETVAAQYNRAFFNGVFNVADDEVHTGAGDCLITEDDDFEIVMPGIDVQQGKG